ncbi:MAG: succinate dehydrogenase, cytochrome b556 subunit [Rhizobiaceae bacterium]|nr:succinate dehydrogenase, cytochrome b556 subunit [Rhizobiaceae bacterium]
MNKLGLGKHRLHKSYFAFLGHRLSGLALAIFLPFHFLALGLAMEGDNALDQMLAFTDNPIVKFAEWGLVILLALHFSFGLRVLLLEFTPWPSRTDPRLGWILPGLFAAAFIGLIFIVQVM